jgi:hypothetical protein
MPLLLLDDRKTTGLGLPNTRHWHSPMYSSCRPWSVMPRVTAGLAPLLLVPLFLAPEMASGGQPEIQVGLVTEISGHWEVQTPKGRRFRLVGGESLTNGSSLLTGDRAAAICISRFDQKKNEWYRVPGNYQGPVALRADEPQVTVSARFQRALKKFFAAPRTTYVPTLSRQQQAISLRDEVVSLKPDGIDLTAIFADAATGQDTVILQRKVFAVRGGKQRLAWSEVATNSVRWQPGEPVQFHAPGLAEGLYRVVLKSDPRGADAIILVSTRGAFAERASEFAEICRLASWWGDGLDLRQRRGRLRSYLDVMADDLSRR